MDNKFAKFTKTHVDGGASEQIVSHLRTPAMVPEEELLMLDYPRCYDMSGEKILIILNQRLFMKTKHFGGVKPFCRDGTNEDVNSLKELFEQLGYRVIELEDLKYRTIIRKLTKIANEDHTRTSCIVVAILTHGSRGGHIYAKDRPYLLSEVMDIFANVTSLIGKPKIYFVQACRGSNRDDGQTAHVGSQSDGILPQNTSQMPSSQDLLETDADSTDDLNCQSKKFITLLPHADTVVLYACAKGYVSYRNSNGSWLIQSLCRQIQDFHKTEDILHILLRVLYEVSLKTSTNTEDPKKSNKKQYPEVAFTLRKNFKFGACYPQPFLNFVGIGFQNKPMQLFLREATAYLTFRNQYWVIPYPIQPYTYYRLAKIFNDSLDQSEN